MTKKHPPSFWAALLLAGSALLWLTGCEDRAGGGAPSRDGRAEPAAERAAITSAPLEMPGEPTGEFTPLPSQSTGIDFVYQWKPPQEHESEAYTQFGGAGVAIGDYDGDGRADVYLSRPFGGGRLYRNLGGWKFQDVTGPAGLGGDTAWGAGCAFADIDNDGDLDLYVCGFNAPNRLFVNAGNGTFTEQAARYGLATRGSSVMMSFADYDRDGDLDGYLARNRYEYGPDGKLLPRRGQVELQRSPVTGEFEVGAEWRERFAALVRPDTRQPILIKVGQRNQLFRNEGGAGFVDVAGAAGVADNGLTLSATWWDYNADGWPDLYVANDFFGADGLYKNNGDGTFADVAPDLLPHTPWFSMGADVADVNNDGLLDFFATDMAGTTHYKSKLGMGDMDAQGWFLEMGKPRQYMRNALFLNTGAGRFMEIAFQAGVDASDWTWSPKFADFDCDGWTDLFIANGMTGDFLNSDLRAKTPGGVVRLADTAPKRDANLAFRNEGGLRFASVGKRWKLEVESVSFGAASGDLDNDGDPDLVVNNWNEACFVYRNDAARGRRVKVRLAGSRSNRWGVDALVRVETAGGVQVRYLTLARGFMSNDEPVALFGLGDAATITRLEVRWPSGHVQEFRNLAADRFYTITEPAGAPPATRPAGGAKPGGGAKPQAAPMFVQSGRVEGVRHRENRYDDFAVQPLLPNRLSTLGPAMVMADLNGDGADDLFLGGAAGEAAQLWLRRDGRLSQGDTQAFGADAACEDIDAAAFDADRDGDLDLYVVSGGYEFPKDSPLLADRLCLNDGAGRFTRAADALPPLRDSGGCVAAGDYDGDGDADLFVGGRVVPGEYPVTPRSRLLRNDSTAPGVRFVDVTDAVAPGLGTTGLATDALWSDADGDGRPDLLVTHEWGPVKLYHNAGGKLADRTEAAGLARRLGWWNALAPGDVDNDGDVDYVVTNFGLNTKYHPSPEKPTYIYYGDFEGDGKCQVVEAAQKAGGLLPVRGKSCSQAAMPHLREKFPTYHQFAISSLEQIYTKHGLEAALKVEANDLHSGVLLNDGKARFTFAPLPAPAQVAPSFGAALVDVDRDGTLDLYMIQNFFGPQRETGHMDGGVSLLLRGAGSGKFEPLWPDRSGLVVPGDARRLAVTDLDGDRRPDFVVAVTDGEVLAFENRIEAPRDHAKARPPASAPAPAGPPASGARVR